MKWIIVVCLFGLALSKPQYEPINLYYHETTGIPMAAAIKRSEESSDFSGNRIIGGSPATLMDNPWFGGLLITLRWSSLVSVCGSSLLSNTKVLTAAHCWFDGRDTASFAIVVLGSQKLFSGGLRISTMGSLVFPSFNPINLHNDIAILTIPFTEYTLHVRNIALPSGDALNSHFTGAIGRIAGYGRQSDLSGISMDQQLHQVNLTVVSNEYCQYYFSPSIVVNTTLCTHDIGRSTCGGDSGGGLVTNNTLIGVASFVSAAGCQRNFAVGFTRVTGYVNWINSNL
ncbi:collagenase-like [Hyposmocoma kahamanoa]|uniref:collagenase-like n=1 Tax=Hyposmocoma kahamanoa TaxID=1477025 RepID=UPI000E6DA4A9|nr:collagenase-like [Hyposmocoma kahamanoa]